MIDGVYPVQFCGARAFAICWRGKKLPMYLGTEREAKQLLWMLQHRDKAQAMLNAHSLDITRPFVERFNCLRQHAYRRRHVRSPALAEAA